MQGTGKAIGDGVTDEGGELEGLGVVDDGAGDGDARGCRFALKDVVVRVYFDSAATTLCPGFPS